MQAQFINPRQFGATAPISSPVQTSSYAGEVSKLSASLARLDEEIQQMENALAPALKPVSYAGEDAADQSVKKAEAPLIDTLETYARHANSMACQVSALRSRLCF